MRKSIRLKEHFVSSPGRMACTPYQNTRCYPISTGLAYMAEYQN